MEYRIKRMGTLVGAFLVLAGMLLFSGCTAGSGDAVRYEGTESEMFAQVLDDLTASLDARDAEAIKKMLTPGVRDSEDLDQQIQKLFAFYPGKTQGHDWDGEHVQGQYTNNFGFGYSQICCGFTLFSEDTPYYCHITFRYSDTLKSGIGVQRICMVSEKVYCSEGFTWPQESGIHVIEDADGDYQTRRVGGSPVVFVPIERTLLEADITAFLDDSTDYSAFTAAFGLPNAEHLSEVFPIYEIVHDDSSARYAYFWLSPSEDSGAYSIDRVQILSAEEELYYLWRADGEY